MEAEGRNYAPLGGGKRWKAVMEAEGRNYAPG